MGRIIGWVMGAMLAATCTVAHKHALAQEPDRPEGATSGKGHQTGPALDLTLPHQDLIDLDEPLESAEEGSPTEAEEEYEIQILERTQDQLERSALWLARNVNSWFGDTPFEEGGRVNGSVMLGVNAREDESFENRIRFRLNARLPNVEVFFGQDDDEDLVTDQQEPFRQDHSLSRDDSRNNRFFAGVGRVFSDTFSFRVGIRGVTRPYAQMRYRETWQPTSRSSVTLAETVFMDSSKGLGSTTSLNMGHLMTRTVAVRWRNTVTGATKQDGWSWSTAAGPIRYLGQDRDLWLDMFAKGNTDNDVNVREYGMMLGHRRPVYKDWVIGEVGVGHIWPRDEDDDSRRSAWAGNASVRLHF